MVPKEVVIQESVVVNSEQKRKEESYTERTIRKIVRVDTPLKDKPR